MSGYNFRVYNYVDSVQLRMYNQVVTQSEKIEPIKEVSSFQKSDCSDVRTESAIRHSEQSSRNRSVQGIYEISRANKWEYFLTLTFDRKKLDSSDYYLLVSKVSTWLNNLRKRYAPDLKYLLVPELHKDGIHYHFHGLLSNIGNMCLIDSGIVKKGMKIYNLKNWKYGFSTVSKVQDNSKVSSYITKYITKDLCAVTKGKKRYWCSKNCDKVKVDYYNLPYEQIQNIVENNSHLLTHISESKVSESGLEVTYIEMKKGETL